MPTVKQISLNGVVQITTPLGYLTKLEHLLVMIAEDQEQYPMMIAQLLWGDVVVAQRRSLTDDLTPDVLQALTAAADRVITAIVTNGGLFVSLQEPLAPREAFDE